MSINVNASTKCKLGTVTSTGTFRMQAGGPGGTVQYHWIRKDTTTVVSQLYSLVVAAGDTAAHSVVTDSWSGPADSGTVQLVVTTPGYAVTPQSFTCRP